MKLNWLLALLISALFPYISFGQNCNNWLYLPSHPSYVRVGDLDITGNQLTIEAVFNRTAPWNGADVYQGDLVSKHDGPFDCNYLLRPSSAEITTSNGYFKTPVICPIQLNKTYHAAMVYDGTTLKFFRNGFLMSQIAATGNLVQNNWQTQIGLFFNQVTQENFLGYINEVRIWNVARSQSSIQSYMNQSLPNPQTTPGLLAYYTFDNLLNKQGNASWNGILGGSASINQTNPNCTQIIDSCGLQSTPVIPLFSTPDTVCVNQPVSITNTSTGASSYYWNFCVADANITPIGQNLGNIGGAFSSPVYIDYVFEGGNYYGFMTNNWPGKLVRLNFGNSLLNTPTATDLGNFGGVLQNTAEGVQVVKNENKWYVIIVGGDATAGFVPRLIKVELGTNIENNFPIATNWGNIGNMSYPHDLYVFPDNGQWFGLTVNTNNNSITRFNFSNSFSNTPTAVNLGNIGNLNGPTGIQAIKDNGTWYAFVTNSLSNTITRLNFGNSLLNTPTGQNLGNINGSFQTVWDIHIMKFCGEIVGYVINANGNNIVRLNFNGSISNIPTSTNLGNIGNLNFPHCISKIFRVGDDLYSFIPNVNNSSLTRLKFPGCTNASIPNSTSPNPGPIIYNNPGNYNINLTVDDSLPTQSAYCKKVVVLPSPVHQPLQIYSICTGGSMKIGTGNTNATYLWNTGATTDSITINTNGTFWVETSRYGCTVRDSFIINYLALPVLDFGYEQDLCNPKNVQFNSNIGSVLNYQWYFGNGQVNSSSQTPSVLYNDFGTYSIKLSVTHNNNCYDSIEKQINISPVLNANLIVNNDTTICAGDSLFLQTLGTVDSCWVNSGGAISTNGYVFPTDSTTYILNSINHGANLILNGNFSSGNTGFTSSYLYDPASGFNPGVYNVGSNITSWHPGMSQCVDHTTGSGNMLMVNGANLPNVEVWSQTVTVQPNTNYKFSTWVQHITSINPAQLQFSINGASLGNVFNANNQSCIWDQFYSSWNSGNATSATISILNMSQQFSGNDFALDDIYFGPVTLETDTLRINITGGCDSVSISGPEKICSSTDIFSYFIYKEPGCNQPLFIDADSSYLTIINQYDSVINVRFKKNGSTSIKINFFNGCKIITDSIDVNIKFSPSDVYLGNDLIVCVDTVITLNSGSGFESYVWQDGSIDSIYIVSATGMYYVNATDFCGMIFRDTFLLTLNGSQPFNVNPVNATVCMGDTIQFNASGGTSYLWQPASNFSDPTDPSPVAIVSQTQDFFLFISDSICLRDTMVTIPVTATAGANIDITKTNDVSCDNDSTILIANGGISYTWSPANHIVRNLNNQITVKPPVTTTFYVDGIDASGCTGTDSIIVYFNPFGDQKMHMPNAFTPNGDGLNDIYRPTFIGPAQKYLFRVYNRWGQLVYESKVPGQGWDGNFGSKKQPNGVYVFYLKAEGGCNGNFENKGTFVLIR